MLYEVPGILSKVQVGAILQRLSRCEFVDGRLTAGSQAATVKKNLELATGEQRMELARIVYTGLAENPMFNQIALPRRMMVPIFSRYDVGMEYGSHADVAMMGINTPEHATRTDLSLTVFLSDQASYDGGELVITSDVGESRFKLPAGHAVVYPSHNLHYVAPVTRGVRFAAVSWVQSFVREGARREVLYELNTVAESLAGERVESGTAEVLFNVYHKLLRMWADC